ncbi:MAG: ATP-binding cassette domain-containing protein, partial [Chloroflexi bacterium]|nr:ATP-binding cassette domain-containing protein [Chloroflexota bacterium]
MPILEINHLSKRFGGFAAIDDLALDVSQSEILGLIGPNGAGKTTLFNIVTGFLRPTRGKILFDGRDITNLRPHEIAQLGIVRTFQISTLFMKSTVFDNVYAAYHMHYKTPVWKAFLHTPSARQEDKVAKQKAMETLDFMGLTSQKDKLAGELSSGYQKALAMCIAFTANPKLLLLDEPVTTLSADKVEMVMDRVVKV